jgi:hypothetical protein
MILDPFGTVSKVPIPRSPKPGTSKLGDVATLMQRPARAATWAASTGQTVEQYARAQQQLYQQRKRDESQRNETRAEIIERRLKGSQGQHREGFVRDVAKDAATHVMVDAALKAVGAGFGLSI